MTLNMTKKNRELRKLHRMPRQCLALDLKPDAALIAEYERYHEKVGFARERRRELLR